MRSSVSGASLSLALKKPCNQGINSPLLTGEEYNEDFRVSECDLDELRSLRASTRPKSTICKEGAEGEETRKSGDGRQRSII